MIESQKDGKGTKNIISGSSGQLKAILRFNLIMEILAKSDGWSFQEE